MNKIAGLLLCLCGVMAAQDVHNLVDWSKLAAKAKEKVDISLEGAMLQMASKFIPKGLMDEETGKKVVDGLQGIYVRTFEFDKAGQYEDADLEPLRSKLRAPGWSRIVEVSSKSENVGVYLMGGAKDVKGVVVIVSEPKELVFVNIVGPIDLDALSALGGKMGLPNMKTGFKQKDD